MWERPSLTHISTFSLPLTLQLLLCLAHYLSSDIFKDRQDDRLQRQAVHGTPKDTSCVKHSLAAEEVSPQRDFGLKQTLPSPWGWRVIQMTLTCSRPPHRQTGGKPPSGTPPPGKPPSGTPPPGTRLRATRLWAHLSRARPKRLKHLLSPTRPGRMRKSHKGKRKVGCPSGRSPFHMENVLLRFLPRQRR